jgi:hypothetical protein
MNNIVNILNASQHTTALKLCMYFVTSIKCLIIVDCMVQDPPWKIIQLTNKFFVTAY